MHLKIMVALALSEIVWYQ